MKPDAPQVQPAFEAHVRDALEVARVHADARLLIGVSGGPDSTALLASLVALRDPCALQLHVVHVDHGLRAEARADAAYIRRLAHRWSVPVTYHSVDVPAMRRVRRGLSIEEAAREARHTAFLETAHDVGADALVLGHTADDQAETVLMNMLRGAGLRGLTGMAAVGESPVDTTAGRRLPVLRPLLTLRRTDIEAYLRTRRLRPRRDPSNLDSAHLRNRVRHELLPLMEQLRNGAGDGVRRAADGARQALDYVVAQADSVWGAVYGGRSDDGVRLNTRAFTTAHPALQQIVLERATECLFGSSTGFGHRHWAAMRRLMETGRTGGRVALPHHAELTRLFADTAVLSVGPPPCPLPQLEPADWNVPGVAQAGGWTFISRVARDRVTLQATGADADAHLPGPLAISLPRDETQALFQVRPRRPGDRMRLSGGTRKVQDILTDNGVPQRWRGHVPVICYATTGAIIWLAGVAAVPGATVHQPTSTRAPSASR